TQEHHVVVGTIRDNIAMARPEAPEDDVRSALAAVDAIDWVDELPDGLSSRVGAGGLTLSAAHAQQLALARLGVHEPGAAARRGGRRPHRYRDRPPAPYGARR